MKLDFYFSKISSAGKIWISPDFDDPLPDEFWLGEGII